MSEPQLPSYQLKTRGLTNNAELILMGIFIEDGIINELEFDLFI